MDGIAAVGIVTAAGAAAQNLAREERFAVAVDAIETRVADGLLVGRHAPLRRLRDDAGEKSDAAQQHERARIGRRGPFRRDQRAFRRKDHVEHFAHALIDVNLGGAFRRVGEIAQDRRNPFDQEGAAGIVGRPVDRAGRLRIGAGEIERDAVAVFDQLEGELVQLRIGDAIVLDIVLPVIVAVGDLRQQFTAERIAAGVEDRLEARFHNLAAEALEQFRHAACAHQAGLHLAVEIGGQRFGDARVAFDDGEHRIVADAGAVEFDRRNGEALLEHRGRRARHRARHAPADIIVMAKGLDVGDDIALMEYRHRAAQVGQVPDRAFGEIRVVHQEHVAGRHGVRRKIAHHGIGHGRVGAAGELAAIAVEQADAVIVGLADHWRARRALDGVFDFRLDGIERALNDLQDDGIDLPRRHIRRSGPGPFLGVHVHHCCGAFAIKRPLRPEKRQVYIHGRRRWLCSVTRWRPAQ